MTIQFEDYEAFFEGESMEVHRQILDPGVTPDWDIEGEVLTDRKMLLEKAGWKVNWTPREANRLAHNIVKWCYDNVVAGDLVTHNFPSDVLCVDASAPLSPY